MKTRIVKRNESEKLWNGLLVLALAVSLAIPPVPVWAGNDKVSTKQGGNAIAAKRVVPPQQPVVQPKGTTRAQTPVLKGQAPAPQAQKQPAQNLKAPKPVPSQAQNQKAKQTAASSSQKRYPTLPLNPAAMLVTLGIGSHIDIPPAVLVNVNGVLQIPPFDNMELRVTVKLPSGAWSASNLVYRFRFVRKPDTFDGKPKFEVWVIVNPAWPVAHYLRNVVIETVTGIGVLDWQPNELDTKIFMRYLVGGRPDLYP